MPVKGVMRARKRRFYGQRNGTEITIKNRGVVAPLYITGENMDKKEKEYRQKMRDFDEYRRTMCHDIGHQFSRLKNGHYRCDACGAFSGKHKDILTDKEGGIDYVLPGEAGEAVWTYARFYRILDEKEFEPRILPGFEGIPARYFEHEVNDDGETIEVYDRFNNDLTHNDYRAPHHHRIFRVSRDRGNFFMSGEIIWLPRVNAIGKMGEVLRSIQKSFVAAFTIDGFRGVIGNLKHSDYLERIVRKEVEYVIPGGEGE